MELALGRLGDAERTLERALELAEPARTPSPACMRGTADMLVGLSRVAWYATTWPPRPSYLRRADELGEPAGLPQNPYRWRVAMARLRAAEGDLAAALELLDEAERVYVGDFSPNVQPVHATRARRARRAGRRGRRTGLGARPPGRRRRRAVLPARVRAPHPRPGPARRAPPPATPQPCDRRAGLLDRLLAAAEDGGRVGTVIEIEVLRALAHDAAGTSATALEALEHAVELAEPDGWVRVFVDAGPALIDLLSALAARPSPD